MNTSIADFARARIQEIDANGAAVAWQIYGLGELPELDWHSQFFSARPYKIEPRSDFPPACVSAESVLIPTHSWVEKIAARYDSSYHPWLFTKSLLRWPVGVGYGVVTATSGVAVGVGGCGLAASGGQGFNAVCEASVRGAGYLIGKSADLVSFTLKPDLRRWKNLPSAVVIQRGDETVDSCLPSAAAETLSDRLI